MNQSQRSADRVMIMDLLGRYAWECDHGSADALDALFAATAS